MAHPAHPLLSALLNTTLARSLSISLSTLTLNSHPHYDHTKKHTESNTATAVSALRSQFRSDWPATLVSIFSQLAGSYTPYESPDQRAGSAK